MVFAGWTCSAQNEVDIESGRTLLPADDQNHGALGWSDRQRAALVDEVLVPGEPPADVARESVADLGLRTDGRGGGDVALGERDPDGEAQPKDQAEETQQAADKEDEDEGAAPGEAAAPARPAPAAPVLGHPASLEIERTQTSAMRILEVAPFVAPIDESRTELGGAQIILQDLSRGLAARGHDVALVAAQGSRVEGVEILDLGIDSTRMQRADLGPTPGERSDEAEQRAAFAKVRAWIDANAADIDVVHAHAYDAPAFAALSGASRPVLHTLHLPPLDARVVAAARSAKDATLVTVSNANAAAWRKAGVPVRTVVPNGIDVSSIPFSRDRGDHLLYAGRISPEKGVAAAIEIAERTRRGILLVGTIYDEAYFAKRIAPRVRAVADAAPPSRVRGAIYIGPRSREEVYALMGHAATFVLPVEWDEPFGLVAVESLASGTPVVAYRRGGLAEIVDYTSGELVTPGDLGAFAAAVAMAVEKDPLECRRRAERFTLEAMVTGYETVLAGLLHG
jgi:UDP-glucose:tetrahydrobiopterin glucosyltransferase